MSKKRVLKGLLVVLAAVLCLFLVQIHRFKHKIAFEAKSEYKVISIYSLASHIKGILDGESTGDYISCYMAAEQMDRCFDFCTDYVKAFYEMFGVRNFRCESGTFTFLSSDDYSVSSEAEYKIANGLFCLSERMISFAKKELDPESPAVKSWLEKVLVKAERFDSLYHEGLSYYSSSSSVQSIQTLNDAVNYLVFFKNLSDFANEFYEVILSGGKVSGEV